MKIKLDENLPYRLVALLDALGHEAHTLHEEGLVGRPDSIVWKAAQDESRFFVRQDLDFSDSRKFAPGTHREILLVRLRSPSRRAIIERIDELFKQEDVWGWPGCFVVATERKIRVLRSEPKQRD